MTLEFIGVIFSSVVAAAASIYSVYLSDKLKAKTSENESLIKEIRKLSDAFQMDLALANEMNNAVTQIFINTVADRFLIFRGFNGKSSFRIASAIYERHKENDKTLISFGATNRYKAYEPDGCYLKLIKKVEAEGILKVRTEDMPECDLKDFYVFENVTEAYIFFLNRRSIDLDNDEIYFGSIATHEERFLEKAKGVLKPNLNIVAKCLSEIYNNNSPAA